MNSSDFTHKKTELNQCDQEALLEKMEAFHFTLGSFFSGEDEITISRDNKEWHLIAETLSIRDLGEPSKSTFSLTEDEVNLLKDRIKELGILNWKEKYWAPVLDGEQWSLAIDFSDGTSFTSNGSNSFPEGFDEFIETLNSLGINDVTKDY